MDAPCEVCGQPAVDYVQDIKEVEVLPGEYWRRWKKDGPPHPYCQEHMRQSVQSLMGAEVMAAMMGHTFLNQLCDALGLQGPIDKVVIEVSVETPVRVYVRGLLDRSKSDAVAGLFKIVPVENVTVTDKADVIVEV